MEARQFRMAARTGALVVSLTAAGLAAFGVSAGARPNAVLEASLKKLAGVVALDLSDQGLQALKAQMGPSAAALAARHDPAGRSKLALGLTPGWEIYNLRNAPSLGLGQLSVEDAKRLNALLPVDAGVGSAKPFVLRARSTAERDRAVRCLANAIYYEAALEPELGQRAVAQVVLNRVQHPEFPKSVCGVVYQGWERTTGCQFSFTCDGSLLRTPMPDIYRRAEQYAREALAGYVVRDVGTATFYHADYVLPYWAPTLSKIQAIGRHIFYRWPGQVGTPPAFNGRYRGGELALSELVIAGLAARPKPVGPDGLPLLPDGAPLTMDTVQVASADGGFDTRVVSVIAGRRQATKDDIARINELLAAKAAESAAPPTSAPAPSAPARESYAADVPMMPAGGAMAVTEVNKPGT